MALADAIREVKERVRPCVECYGLAEDERCPICADTRRDRTLICVVESPQDTEPIERTAAFRGVYHVLGGALSPIDGVDPDDLRIGELVRRVDEGGVEEVILATNPTMTGEATASYVADLLREKHARHAAGQRPARRRRPGVRRRGHARPRPRRPSRAVARSARRRSSAPRCGPKPSHDGLS